MNMWKKTMTATVACLMTFSLAACGSSDEGKQQVSAVISKYIREIHQAEPERHSKREWTLKEV